MSFLYLSSITVKRVTIVSPCRAMMRQDAVERWAIFNDTKGQGDQQLTALCVTKLTLKQSLLKPSVSPSHFLWMTLSVSERYVCSAHYPGRSSSLPPDGSLTSAAAPACPAGMAPGWGVEYSTVSADRLSAREHCVSGTLVPVNKQNRTCCFLHGLQRSSGTESYFNIITEESCQSHNKWLSNLKGQIWL